MVIAWFGVSGKRTGLCAPGGLTRLDVEAARACSRVILGREDVFFGVRQRHAQGWCLALG